MEEKLTYEDYKERVNIRELLEHAGYIHSRRDGLRYPTYVRLDDHGKRIKGDKFIVTANGKCCFKPPEQKNYNVISFIKEHAYFFPEYQYGMDKDRLVNMVCCKILGQPQETKCAPSKEALNEKPFSLNDYDIVKYDRNQKDVYLKFYPYFKPRGIDLITQSAFGEQICLSTNIRRADGKRFTNLAFPFRTPSKDDVVGFELRSLKRQDGSSFKGKALGTDSVNGLWIASPAGTPVKDAANILWFESAFDAMAYYQIMRKSIVMDKSFAKNELKEGMISREEARERLDSLDKLLMQYNQSVYLSTGGSPSEHQFKGILKAAPEASHFLCFDNDRAGQLYSFNFMMHKDGRYFNSYATEDGNMAFIDRTKAGQGDRKDFDPVTTSLDSFCESMGINRSNVYRMSSSPGYKDWNDQLLDKRQDIEESEQEAESLETTQGMHR